MGPSPPPSPSFLLSSCAPSLDYGNGMEDGRTVPRPTRMLLPPCRALTLILNAHAGYRWRAATALRPRACRPSAAAARGARSDVVCAHGKCPPPC